MPILLTHCGSYPGHSPFRVDTFLGRGGVSGELSIQPALLTNLIAARHAKNKGSPGLSGTPWYKDLKREQACSLSTVGARLNEPYFKVYGTL